ncbi:MAG: 4a-hydroxytetrahydrobiopterin dehydratase [Allobranchiibius sp.]|nr:4a-hydroxytetrahydrobiopterin dehydratase [Actinomycetota bacterium]
MDTVTDQQFRDADLPDWHKAPNTLHASFEVPDYRAAATFITAIAEAAESAVHHPDLSLTYGTLDLTLCSHDDGTVVTQKDLDLAAEISRLAAAQGRSAQHDATYEI